MFRLLKSGLPKDPVFPSDLVGLGYFINDEDEVRMITNPRAYFNFFLTKNDRHNDLQREAMNSCLRDEILKRLHGIGMETVRLPLGTEETQPHVPILVSSNISEKKRIIILLYEHTQDLGVFAYRVVGGRGGINAGSAVNFVEYIKSLSGPNGKDSPGVILANLGQLRWWRRGGKAVTHTSWFSLPQKSAVSGAYRFDILKNTVPGNRNTAEHIAYIFNSVIQDLLAPDATLEVIGVSVGAVEVVDFLNKPQNWAVIEPRLTALALVATFHRSNDISNPWFADWLRKRARAYVISSKPAGTPLAPPNGKSYTDPNDTTIKISDHYGCPVYSLGEPYYSELMLPKGYKTVINWFQEVVIGGEEYENPEIIIKSDLHVEEKLGEETKQEELQDTEVKIGGLKSEECMGEENEVDMVETCGTEAEKIDRQVPEVEELNVMKNDTNDPYIKEIKEAEHISRMDWSEEVWEEAMKKDCLINENRKTPKIKEEQATEGEAHGGASVHKLDVKGQDVEKMDLGEFNGDQLKECEIREDNFAEESNKAHGLRILCCDCWKAEAAKENASKEEPRHAVAEGIREIYDPTADKILKSAEFTSHDIKKYMERLDKQMSGKADNWETQDANAEHANGDNLSRQENKTEESDIKKCSCCGF